MWSNPCISVDQSSSERIRLSRLNVQLPKLWRFLFFNTMPLLLRNAYSIYHDSTRRCGQPHLLSPLHQTQPGCWGSGSAVNAGTAGSVVYANIGKDKTRDSRTDKQLPAHLRAAPRRCRAASLRACRCRKRPTRDSRTDRRLPDRPQAVWPSSRISPGPREAFLGPLLGRSVMSATGPFFWWAGQRFRHWAFLGADS